MSEPMEEGFVRRLREALSKAPGGPAAPACGIEPESVWDAAAGRLPPPDARALLDHSLSCPTCADAWRLAGELQRQIGSREAPSARRAWWLAAAAALLFVALSGAALLLRREAPVYREQDQEAIRSLIAEDLPMPRAEVLLRWSPGPDASRYQLEVTTANLRSVFRASALTRPEARVPESALATIASGTRLYWRVETLRPDGRRVVSPTFAVVIE